MAVRKNGKIREVSLDTLDEKLLERDRLENVLASIGKDLYIKISEMNYSGHLHVTTY